MTAQEIGTRVGRAMARDVLAEGWDRRWTGLDAQDAGQFVAAGIQFDSPAWVRAETASKLAYEDAIAARSN